jgi:type I restriction enzyme, S subunit
MSSERQVNDVAVANHALHSPAVGLLPVSAMISGQRRLESEAYLTGGYSVRVRIFNARVPHEDFSTWAEVRQPGRLRAITVPREHGLPFLAATQVFDIRPTPRKWLAPGRIPELEARYATPGTILVTRSGSVGECIIAYEVMPILSSLTTCSAFMFAK